MSSQFFHREPTFWIVDHPEYNKPDRESFVLSSGKRVRVKHPQGAHQGSYEQPIRVRGEGTSYLTVVKTNGNAVFYKLTSGAADVNVDSDYARERRQKMRACGWYPLAACPVSLLKNGELQPGHFFDASLLDAMPCDHGTYSLAKPCPHALAEQVARVAANNAIGEQQELASRNKLVEAQKAQTAALVEAQNAQTAAILAAQQAQTEAILALAAKPEKSGKTGKAGE